MSHRRRVARERTMAKLARRLLILVLGSQCAICGRRKGPWHLDHWRKRRTWSCRGPSRMHRMRLYLQDWLDNKPAPAVREL